MLEKRTNPFRAKSSLLPAEVYMGVRVRVGDRREEDHAVAAPNVNGTLLLLAGPRGYHKLHCPV